MTNNYPLKKKEKQQMYVNVANHFRGVIYISSNVIRKFKIENMCAAW